MIVKDCELRSGKSRLLSLAFVVGEELRGCSSTQTGWSFNGVICGDDCCTRCGAKTGDMCRGELVTGGGHPTS